MMKRVMVSILAVGLLFAGCAKTQGGNENPAPTESQNPTMAATEAVIETEAVVEGETARVIVPLPDSTMDNLTDAILPISLEVGDAYYNENGIVEMDLTVYSYDKYDMVDIANLNVGDTIVRHSGEVVITSLERNEAGTVYINGGFENDGFDLATDDSGIFYERGYNDSRNWYAVGEVNLQLADNFVGIDNADLDYRDLTLTPDNFLNDNIIIFDFTPYNTTIRVEGGQIVELNRRYVP